MAPSLVQSVVVALVGFALTGQVEQALKDRQATVSSVTAMNTLLDEIAKQTQDAERLKLVRRLSMYGVDAIGPLVTLALSGEITTSVPADGLNLIAVRHPAEVCAALANAARMSPLFLDVEVQMDYLKGRAKELDCAKRGTPW